MLKTPDTTGNRDGILHGGPQIVSGQTGQAVVLDGEMNVNTNQWATLAEADHEYELEPLDGTAFNLDHLVTGVGGTPVEPLDRYQVALHPASFEFLLRPFTVGDADPMALSKRRLPDHGGAGNDGGE